MKRTRIAHLHLTGTQAKIICTITPFSRKHRFSFIQKVSKLCKVCDLLKI